MALKDPTFRALLPRLAERGMRLAVRGRGESPIDPEFLPLFEYALIGASEDHRKPAPPPGVKRAMRFMITGAQAVGDVDEAFGRGAAGTIGWPMGGTVLGDGKGLQASQAAVIKMLALVNQYADVGEIEQAMKIDPAIAFKLMKFINSPIFGGSTKITSFSHAIMMLGYKKMLRWLALLMSSSSKDVNNLPAMHASVRRGLFMEQLAGTDAEKKDALFIAGAFSLIDRITMQPMEEVFKSISVSNDIRDAVMSRTGPLAEYLLLIEAIEKGIPSKIFALQNKLGISAMECNAALLSALTAAEEFDFV